VKQKASHGKVVKTGRKKIRKLIKGTCRAPLPKPSFGHRAQK
jgi:hypothetical protein